MKTFKKYYALPAPPEEVYLALTKAQSIQLWTGAEVEFTEEVGTEFSFWDGDIVGKNIEFDAPKKIVQQWYFGDQPEESIVTFILHPDKKWTSVELRHTNIPDSDIEDMIDGWNLNFFGSLQDFYEE